MLSGTYIYGMDRKGRLVLPAPFRQELGDSIILTRAPGRCLLALSPREWRRLQRRHRGDRAFRSLFVTTAQECRLDVNTRRFLVPYPLREWAELKPMDEVALYGTGQAVQIAKRRRWEEMLDAGELLLPEELDTEPPVSVQVEALQMIQRAASSAGALPLQTLEQVRRLAEAALRDVA